MESRIRVVGIIFLFGAAAIFLRLSFWQIVKGEDLSSQAKMQQVNNGKITARRGNILASDGSWLSASVDYWTLYASKPELKSDVGVISNSLAPILLTPEEPELDASGSAILSVKSYKEQVSEEVLRLHDLLSKDLVWIPLARRLTDDEKSKVESLSIEGLGFEAEEGRFYPEASSSAQLLGFVGKDDDGSNKGYFGLEGYYDFTLSGRPGFLQRESDGAGNPLLFGKEKKLSAREGVDLVTNIDKTVQLVIEKNLSRGIEKYGAKSGSIIVMNPKTGAILGMASFPSYDPFKYYEYGDEYFKNPVISDFYEPGSIFKPIVMAAGLDAGVVSPDTPCDICNAPFKVDKYFIKTWNNEYHANSTMTDVIKNSDNVGMVFVGQKLGIERLYDYLDKFGFGHLTGIDLQGEFTNSLRAESEWNIVDAATTTFGQGIAVTPIQMVKAIATIANDGTPPTPQVVDRLKTKDWEDDIQPVYSEKVISKKAADEITEMMVNAVSNGESKWAVPKGYKIAGKTGTAQIPVEGHYDEDKTLASFVGFAPPDNPEFLMLVMLREPETSQWASETAAPLWFSISKELFPYLGVKPGS